MVWSVARSFISTVAKNASVLLILVDIIVEVVAVATVVFIPDKFTNPIDCVPIPMGHVVKIKSVSTKDLPSYGIDIRNPGVNKIFYFN